MAIDTKALAPYQQFDNRQLEIIKRTVASSLNKEQFLLFVEVCKHYRLNPMARQIYGFTDNKGRMVVQTSIDGFRLMAERTKLYGGQIGPEWCGEDGKWVDVWLKKEPPAAARVGIIRRDFDKPVWGVARYSSYAGTSPNWSKMPEVMISKCAESLAFRKAFPAEMGGIYTHEEMEQAANEMHVPVYAIQEVETEEVIEASSEPEPINKGQIITIQKLREKLGQAPLPGVEELTFEDAKAIVTQLNADIRANASKPVQPVQQVQVPAAPKQEELDPAKALKSRMNAVLERAKALNQFEIVEGDAVKNVAAFLKFASTVIGANVTHTSHLTASRLETIEKYLDAKDAA